MGKPTNGEITFKVYTSFSTIEYSEIEMEPIQLNPITVSREYSEDEIEDFTADVNQRSLNILRKALMDLEIQNFDLKRP